MWFEELGRRAANWLTLWPTPKTPTTVWVGRRTHAPLKHLKHTHSFSLMERIVDYAAAAPGAGRIDVTVTHLACIWNMYMAYVLGGDNNGDFLVVTTFLPKGKLLFRVWTKD